MNDSEIFKDNTEPLLSIQVQSLDSQEYVLKKEQGVLKNEEYIESDTDSDFFNFEMSKMQKSTRIFAKETPFQNMSQYDNSRTISQGVPQFLKSVSVPPPASVNSRSSKPKSTANPSMMFSKKSQQKAKQEKDEFKTEFTFWDRTLIILLHLIEPTLLGLIIGFSLQISELSTTLYLFISLFVNMPMLLTENQSKINFKLKLTFVIVCMAPVVIFFKSWLYVPFTKTTISKSSRWLQFFGIFTDPNLFAKTFVVDMVVFFLSCLLVWHYYSQIAQVEARKAAKGGTLKYQIKIKFHHFLFGESTYYFYLIAFIMFMLDTFIIQTIVLAIVTVIQLILLLYWSFAITIPQNLRDYSLRFIQILGYAFLAVDFVISFPADVFDDSVQNQKNQKIYEMFGIDSLRIDFQSSYEGQKWWTRVHLILLSFAIVFSEVYFVCQKVQAEAQKQIIDAQMRQQQEQFANLEYLRTSNYKQMQYSPSPNARILQQKIQPVNKQSSIWDWLQMMWKSSKITMTLWICRFLCFIQVYMYHDYQSLVPLLWLLGSTVFKRSRRFVRFTTYFFFPLMIAVYLFYFTVNIPGLVSYPDSKYPHMYKYGFYNMSVPFLQFGLLYTNLFFLALYMRLVYKNEMETVSFTQKTSQEQTLLLLEKHTLYQLYYLFILYINYPIFLFLIMSGLAIMDFYHVFMLFVFVWAALYPEAFQRNVILILLYADLFVLMKYIFTLVINNQYSEGIYKIIGISSTYDPSETNQYFRYEPKIDQWVLVLLTFAQYRRQNILGTDIKKIRLTEAQVLNSLAAKNPTLYKISKVFSIVYNHLIVIATFLLYLLIIGLMTHSFVNFVSLVLILALLCAYLYNGIKMLLRYFKIVSYWTAFVLLTQLGFQFMMTTKFKKNTWLSKHLQYQAYIYWMGYEYKSSESKIWLYFLPYVTMFFLSIILKNSFQSKLDRELKDLSVQPESYTETYQNTMSSVELAVNNSEVEITQTPQTRQSMRASQFKFVSSQERRFLDNEDLYTDMQYKLSYLLWKVKIIWPLLDVIALYFNLVLSISILSFALYFQIAVVWLVYLAIFLIQTRKINLYHQKYLTEQMKRFKESRNNSILAVSANQARIEKLIQKQDELPDIVTKILASIDSESSFIDRFQNQERIILTDEEAIEEYRKYKSEIHKITLNSRASIWLAQFIILIFAIAVIYLGLFITAKDPNTSYYLIPIDLQPLLIFHLFFAGMFRNSASLTDENPNNQFIRNYYPFVIFLLLLIFEKLCQMWLTDRFGTNDEIIQVFAEIEENYEKQKYQINTEKIEEKLSRSTAGSNKHAITLAQSSKDISPASKASAYFTSKENLIFDPDLGLSSRQASDSLPKIELIQQTSFEVIVAEEYNQSFSSTQESTKKTQKELLDQIKPLINIKQKIILDRTFQAIMMEFVILLVWFSCIYKLNVLSFFLFIVLVIHTYRHKFHINTFSYVRHTVATIFIIQYLVALMSLSSYNSPVTMPAQITDLYGVYPNPNNTYLAVPFYFNLTQQIQHQNKPKINVNWYTFFSVFISNSRLNGIWFDFFVTAMLYFYLNIYNIWLLHEPHKVSISLKTQDLMQQYNSLQYHKYNASNEKQLRRQMADEQIWNRFVDSISVMVYTNFGLIMIVFVLFVSIFSQSLLSFGYFIFCMILIYRSRQAFFDPLSSQHQLYILSWLIPYLLVDILLQLLYQIPFGWSSISQNNGTSPSTSTYFNDIGFYKVWSVTPITLSFGENVQIVETLTNQFGEMYLKGATYFMISIQIQILQSIGYKKFNDMILLDNAKHEKAIGTGMAYRLNNFKNQQVLKQAEDYGGLERMLNHVKNLIKRREQYLYNQNQKSTSSGKIKPIQQPEIIYEEEEEKDQNDVELKMEADETQDFKQFYKVEIETEYKKRLQQLSFVYKMYLWMRRNLVQDILFKHSNEHMMDIVEQFRLGRTSIRTQLELGIMYKVKTDWFKTMDEKLKLNMLSVIEDEAAKRKYENFILFRKEQFLLSQPKPWERLDQKNFMSGWKLLQDYLVMFWKIIASHTHLICFFFMLLTTIENGGFLYMVYPSMIFGHALLQENRPGKHFWWFVIIYTQVIIVLQFMMQLKFPGTHWQTFTTGLKNFSDAHNIGLVSISSVYQSQVKAVLAKFYSEILVLVFVLINIQQETLAGLFNVNLQDYESFAEGLDRYIRIVLENDLRALQEYQNHQEAKFITEELLFDDQLVIERRNSAPDILQTKVQDQNELWFLDDLQLEVLVQGVQMSGQQKKRSQSLVDKSEMKDLLQELKENHTAWQRTQDHIEKNTRWLWDNSFFDQLFPIIRQQKPGKDLYVWLSSVCVFMFFYILLFYANMARQKSTLAEQITQNQLQPQMIFSVLGIILLMFCDRVFYSTYTFMSMKMMEEKLNTNAPLIEKEDQSQNISNSVEQINQQRNNSIKETVVMTERRPTSVRDSGTLAERRTTQRKSSSIQRSRLNNSSFYVGGGGAVQRQQRNNSVSQSHQSDVQLDTLEVSLQQVELTEEKNIDWIEDDELKNQHAYYQSLLPQKQAKTWTRVLKYYYLWAVIILSHWYVFFFLVKQKNLCGSVVPYSCNQVASNPSLWIFYIILCVYLTIQAYQVQLGLPELRKGGFMIGKYNSISKTVFQVWYQIPFLFELRTIIDWTFNKTALDVFQSIKLAQVQSDVYIAKCTNKPYMQKTLGAEEKWYKKLAIGGLLLIFVLVLIIGPMFLFSKYNPAAVYNPVLSADLTFKIEIDENQQQNNFVMFQTSQITKTMNLTQDQFDSLGFSNSNATQTNVFKPMQTQAIQFSNISDNVWTISPPRRQYLIDALNLALTDPNSNVSAILQSDMRRLQTQAPYISIQNKIILDSSQSVIINQLINMIECNGINDSTSLQNYSVPILHILQSTSPQKVTQIQIDSNAKLTYICDQANEASNYWMLTASFNSSSPLYSTEKQIFTGQGFGIIVFNQQLLPSALAAYSSSIIIFYATIVYIIASSFRQGFVPLSYQIFIIDAVNTEDIIMICQCIYIYRKQLNLVNEEELYMILIDIMRSPETIKAITGTSLKKKLD